MPTLQWVGKDKVVNHHLDVPFRVLNKVSSFRAPEGTPANSTDNRIIHGDNLEALKSLLPEFEGKVKCIYIDPPYNTGNEGWVYNDAVNDPKIKRWLGQVVGKEGEDLSRHDKWLCMMYPRLKLLHRLLHDDGSIWVPAEPAARKPDCQSGEPNHGVDRQHVSHYGPRSEGVCAAHCGWHERGADARLH